MKKTVLTFGLISGAIISIMMAATVPFMEEIGYDRGAFIGYTSMVVAFLLIYFGIRSYRDNVAGGSVRFGRAFVIGALITAVASACYVATWQVVYYGYVPDFPERYTEHVLEQEQAGGATEAALAEKRAEMEEFAEWYRNPLVNIALTFLEPLPVGLVIKLVSAGILSRGRRESGVVKRNTAVAR
jgi:hypothetical protein